MWACGRSDFGQSCLGNKKSQTKPRQTSFSNISKISSGYYHSLFQNNQGEIFACGYNRYGECGLGHFKHPQMTPSLILNLPSNIVQFICGSHESLFLDSEGNVFSGKNILNKIPDIPPIKIISCVHASCYLIDFEGNIWSFGFNDWGQLGHGDKTHLTAPKVINTLQDIQQISYGCSGHHFFAKNSQNQIFATGNNSHGQLGTGDYQSLSIPKEMNSQYSVIWRDEFYTRAKSARK